MDRRRPRKPPIRPLVLIVESHDDTRMLYELALPAMGCDVVAARNDVDPYTLAWAMHPDIIVTDLAVANYDGWQLLRDLRQDPRTRDIPMIAVTAYVQQSARMRAEHDGFAAFFTKPCMPDELASGIRQVLHRSVHAQVER